MWANVIKNVSKIHFDPSKMDQNGSKWEFQLPGASPKYHHDPCCTFCKEPNFLHVELSSPKKHFPKSLLRAWKQLGFMNYINVSSSTLNADSSTQLRSRHFKEWRKQDRFSHPTIILSHKLMGVFLLTTTNDTPCSGCVRSCALSHKYF